VIARLTFITRSAQRAYRSLSLAKGGFRLESAQAAASGANGQTLASIIDACHAMAG
jgi:hypothetical protein